MVAGSPARAMAATETTTPVTAPAPTTPRVLLDGYPLPFPDVPPTIIDNRTLVPFRAIAEALGVSITWHQETHSIDATAADLGLNVHLAIGQNSMSVNGKPIELDVPPQIVDSRTLVPLRAFSSAFNVQVGWDQPTRTVSLTSPARQMQMLGFYALGSYAERQYVANFSDMAYGWSSLTAKGQVDTTSTEYRWPEPDGATTGDTLLTAAAASHTRRYLMLFRTDGDNQLTALVKDSTLSAQAAANIAAAVQAHGFDGVVLDLEGLGLDDKNQPLQGAALQQVRQGYTRLVTEVAAQLHARGQRLILALPPLNGAYPGYDYAALAPQADQLMIMAYDYQKAQRTDPEPLDRVDEAIRLALGQVPAQKLLLGIEVGSDGTYETAATLPQKIGLAKRYGLGGISLWRLGVLGADRMNAINAAAMPLK
ncbi:MAG: stalk domain-containing protein [Mycobacterium leprae]